MAHVFIGGNPVSGKSTLARQLANKTGGIPLHLDRFRSEMRQDDSLRYWTDFFLNQDEWAYWQHHTFEQHWENMTKRAEAFWPYFRSKIQEATAQHTTVIIESGSLMPAQWAELSFPGVYLVGTDQETIYRRLRTTPGWGTCSSLQRMEAAMYAQEGERMQTMAAQYDFPVWNDPEAALASLLTLAQAPVADHPGS